ncbi:hypothetical protein [Thermaurantiacus sp.]
MGRCVAVLIALLVSGPAVAQPAGEVPTLAWSADEIRTLARTQYFEGVPYDLVRSFPPAVAQPVLLKLLADPAEKDSWPNAAAMLGMIGNAEVASTLIDFITRGDGRALSPVETRAKSSAILGLGYLAQRTGSPAAVSFLASAARPGGVRVNWQSGLAADAAARDRQLAETATLALGLAATPASRKALDSVSRSAVGEDVVAEAIRTHEAVRRDGMLGYYGMRELPTLKLIRPGQLQSLPLTRRSGPDGAVAAPSEAVIEPAPEAGRVIATPTEGQTLTPPRRGETLRQPGPGTPEAIPNPVPTKPS